MRKKDNVRVTRCFMAMLLPGCALIFIFLILITGCSTTQEILEKSADFTDLPVEQQLQKALEMAVDHPATILPGAAVYVRSRAGTWKAAAGVANLETGQPLTPDMRFRAGSIMKSFVATVVLQLVEEGKLDLDDPLPKILPAAICESFEHGSSITLRQLLSHTSGIPDWLTPKVLEDIVSDLLKIRTPEHYVEIAGSLPTVFAPGESWQYSNTNYNLIGMVIEGTTGRPWRREIEDRILGPLGLANTFLPEPGTAAITVPHARGYNKLPGHPELAKSC